jgi:hypothetical protein
MTTADRARHHNHHPDRGRMPSPTAEQVAAGSLSSATRALPHQERLQPLFGHHDLRTIRVSDSAGEAEARRRVRSSAFTLGDRVSLPADAPVAIAAHEAVHVVQHRLGGGQSEAAAEVQADRLAQVAASGRPVAHELPGAGRTAYPVGAVGPARLMRAPNQAGTTDPEEAVGWVASHEAGVSASAVLTALSDDRGENIRRYFYTDTYGWVDLRHFGAAASWACSLGSVATEGMGLANEGMQWITEWGDDYRSGFSPEDTPSNAAGASFGDDYVGSREGESTSAALRRWMADHGARAASDPAAGRAALPATDPAERGGAARGSSNASRTQSTASGAAAASRDSAERGLGQLFDWRNWAALYGMPLP